MTPTAIATGAPLWVYALLVGLIALGIQRLQSREVPLFIALLPSIAFLAWSLLGAHILAETAGNGFAALSWFGGAAVGVFSAFVLPEPRGGRRPGGRILLPATWLPLALYLLVFVARFACGVWAALRPAQALTATAIGLAIGAAMTARLIVAVVRWRQPIDAA